MNARNKKHNVVPIRTRKPKSQANNSVAKPLKKQLHQNPLFRNPRVIIGCLNHNLFSIGQFCDVDLEVDFQKSACFVRDLQGNDLLIGLVPQRQKVSDYENSGPVPQLQNVSPLADTSAPLQQELDLLFGLLYDEFFNAGLVPQRQKVSDYENSGPVPQLQNVSPLADTSAPLQQELDLLFGLLYDEFFNADLELMLLKTSRIYANGLLVLVEDLMLLVQIIAAR
nr:integrase, catalytic region, zinc finger, CCHC-type, peptidase aspartic, catalytic [Tanacetum cinerariifolium]